MNGDEANFPLPEYVENVNCFLMLYGYKNM
jgi:hypothetical protein